MLYVWECVSWRIAGILCGKRPYNAGLESDLEAGRIVFGGCVRTDHDPPGEVQTARFRWEDVGVAGERSKPGRS